MKLFFLYLKLHYKSLMMFTAFSLVFSLVFYLYSLPMEPVFYSIALCVFIGSVITAAGFFRFKKRHELFVALRQSVKWELGGLPAAQNLPEEDYAELVRILFSEKCRAESEKAATVSEMTDYYTLWAHQIKTPIAAMNLLLQSGESNTGELSEQLFKIEQYVGMVLTYLRCGSDSSDFVFRKQELDTIVRGAVKKYARQFIREKISLDFRETSLTVLTDEKWLSFVIEQIISNALKYTKSGKISIYSEPGSVLVIEDTGIGIAPEDLPRVCENGFTGYNGRADKKSTGIGLYLCKKVLDSLSHKLTITSQVGIGTKVSIDLSSVETKYE